MATQSPSAEGNTHVVGGDPKSMLHVWAEKFPVDNRSKVLAALLVLTAIGYYISWIICATLVCLVVIPLLEMMNKDRRARNAVQSADRVIGGAMATGRRALQRTVRAKEAQLTEQDATTTNPAPPPATKAI